MIGRVPDVATAADFISTDERNYESDDEDECTALYTCYDFDMKDRNNALLKRDGHHTEPIDVPRTKVALIDKPYFCQSSRFDAADNTDAVTFLCSIDNREQTYVLTAGGDSPLGDAILGDGNPRERGLLASRGRFAFDDIGSTGKLALPFDNPWSTAVRRVRPRTAVDDCNVQMPPAPEPVALPNERSTTSRGHGE